jgi:hypothetical protein
LRFKNSFRIIFKNFIYLYDVLGNYPSRLNTMKDLLAVATSIVALAAILMVGGAIVSKTYNVSFGLVPTETSLTTMKTDIFSSLTTLTGFLPVLIIAIIGGYAIYYVVSFLRGSGSM